MYGKSISRALALTATAFVVQGRAADPSFDPQNTSYFAASIESPDREPVFFWDRFNYAFESDVNNVFSDALSPLNVIAWNVQLSGRNFVDQSHSRAAGNARGAITDSFTYSLREAAVATPVMSAFGNHNDWMTSAVRDSLDNVGEEYVRPANPSYRAVEQTWWNDLSKSGGTHFGIRPLMTTPYAYLSQNINDGEKTIFQANVRYYYDHFSAHRFELATEVPLADGWNIDFGSGYTFGSRNERDCAVKLVKELKCGGIAHVGLQVREHPMVIAGITFMW